jgi:hypothetical protein
MNKAYIFAFLSAFVGCGQGPSDGTLPAEGAHRADSGVTHWSTSVALRDYGVPSDLRLRYEATLHLTGGGTATDVHAYLVTIDGGEGGFPTRYMCETDVTLPAGSEDFNVTNADTGQSIQAYGGALNALLTFASDATGPVECRPHGYPSADQIGGLRTNVRTIPLPGGGTVELTLAMGAHLHAVQDDGRWSLTGLDVLNPTNGRYPLGLVFHDANGSVVGSGFAYLTQ